MPEENLYHIYARGECLYNCLNETEFNKKWTELKAIVGLMKTDYTEKDLTFIVSKKNPKER